jgi:hypothetical protein
MCVTISYSQDLCRKHILRHCQPLPRYVRKKYENNEWSITSCINHMPMSHHLARARERFRQTDRQPQRLTSHICVADTAFFAISKGRQNHPTNQPKPSKLSKWTYVLRTGYVELFANFRLHCFLLGLILIKRTSNIPQTFIFMIQANQCANAFPVRPEYFVRALVKRKRHFYDEWRPNDVIIYP